MRPTLRLVPLLALATSLSCANMPTSPSVIVTVTGQITDRDGPGIEQARLHFRSLDPRDQQPQPGPIVYDAPQVDGPRAKAHRSASLDAMTVTDANGRFRIQLPAGPYEVYVEPERGYPFVEIQRVTFDPAHTELNYRYTGVRVTGAMTGPGGMALPGGFVQVYMYRPDQPSISAGADLIAGRYTLLIPPGTYELRASAQATFGLPILDRQLTVVRDTTVDLDLDGFALTGIVVGQNGLPLERIRVEAASDPQHYPVATYTKPDGTYLMYLPSGTYAFHLEPWDSDDRYIAERDYPPASITSPAVLNFDMSGVEWTGTVRRSSDSTVVSDAFVNAVELSTGYPQNGAASRTDTAGKFRLIVARNTFYNLFVSAASASRLAGTFATVADTTFDLYTDSAPIP